MWATLLRFRPVVGRATVRSLRCVGSTSSAARTSSAPKLLRLAGTAGLGAGVAYLATSQGMCIDAHKATLIEDLVEARHAMRVALKQQWVLEADAAQPQQAVAEETVRVDPDTSMPHPLYLNLSTVTPPLTLVGLGVRKVSFLKVKVYSAGFYLEETATKGLDDVPGWHTYTAAHLLTPPTPSKEPGGSPQLSGEGLMKSLLDTGVRCAVRIVPVRNTDFGHLNHGFARAVGARQKLAKKADQLSDADEVRIADSLQQLKSLCPPQTVPKGKALILLRTPAGLTVEYEGKVLGTVNDPWMARELMLAYFADNNVISPKLKEDVANQLEKLSKH